MFEPVLRKLADPRCEPLESNSRARRPIVRPRVSRRHSASRLAGSHGSEAEQLQRVSDNATACTPYRTDSASNAFKSGICRGTPTFLRHGPVPRRVRREHPAQWLPHARRETGGGRASITPFRRRFDLHGPSLLGQRCRPITVDVRRAGRSPRSHSPSGHRAVHCIRRRRSSMSRACFLISGRCSRCGSGLTGRQHSVGLQ